MAKFPRFLPLLIFFTLLFFWKLAFTDLILARGDTYLYFYPLWAARDLALRAGELPFWTPNAFMGAPLFSDPQVGTLYPPNWLTIWLAPPDAVRISILLHIFWATLGAFLLARRVVKLDFSAALAAAVIFGFGGFVGAHVEQINQLQGVAWLPWAMLTYHIAIETPLKGIPLLAMVFALQIFSGHTQTVFITGVGLGLYGIVGATTPTLSAPSDEASLVPTPDSVLGRRTQAKAVVIRLVWLVFAVVIAVLLALPQLYASLELTGMSNRGSGFESDQVLAFSWNPLLIGRGMLPSYDAQVFSEYVAYSGVIGLALALWGAFKADRRRWVWLMLVAAGIFLALGAYNPINWTLAGLPGFNLFRVPARWLALVALGVAMLAGLGVQHLRHRFVETTLALSEKLIPSLVLIVGIIGLIAASTLLADRAALEVDGMASPGLMTFAAWGVALGVFISVVILNKKWSVALVIGGLVIELWLASAAMPYNDLVDPAAYHDARFTVYQLQALCPNEPTCGRFLSITNGFFDPGDKVGLEQRYAALGLTERATRYAFTAAKLKEVVAPNLAMVWGLPSVDGYGGGVLPTAYYTQFTSLMLPPGMLRTLDGRLREMLALETCRGACIPESRWLNLTNTQYLIVDKTFDLSQDGIRYDTTFELLPNVSFEVTTDFVGDTLNVLYTGTPPTIDIGTLQPLTEINGLQLATIRLDMPQALSQVRFEGATDTRIRALTLVDSRTGTFKEITLGNWRLVLSSDVKIYENLDVLPRTIVLANRQVVPESWDSTEQALTIMRDPGFNPAQTVIIASDQPLAETTSGQSSAEITHYAPTRVEITANASSEAYLLLTDAYYPGWKATVNGESVPVYRANAMFRAVPIPVGENSVIFEYAPDWLPTVFIIGGIAWVIVMIGLAIAHFRVAKSPDKQIGTGEITRTIHA